MNNLLLFLLILTPSLAKHGVDIENAVVFTSIQCLVNAGVDFMVVRGYTDMGSVEDSAIANLRFIQNIGIPGDIYMGSCRGRDATTQANDMMDSIPANLYNKVWITVQKNQNQGCDWGSFPSAGNCEYLKQLLAAVKARGKEVGIFSDYYSWQSIFRSLTGCPEVGTYPLWYGSNDRQDNFNSYKAFGGFSLPVQKAYASVSGLCGLNNIGLDYKI